MTRGGSTVSKLRHDNDKDKDDKHQKQSPTRTRRTTNKSNARNKQITTNTTTTFEPPRKSGAQCVNPRCLSEEPNLAAHPIEADQIFGGRRSCGAHIRCKMYRSSIDAHLCSFTSCTYLYIITYILLRSVNLPRYMQEKVSTWANILLVYEVISLYCYVLNTNKIQ